jgi:hypothetical protein
LNKRWLVCLCVLALLPLSGFIPLSGTGAQAGAAVWSAPKGFFHNMEVDFPSANAGATQVVFLNPYSTIPGATEWYYDRQVLFMETTGGAWTTPVVIGSNGMYRPTGWVPVTTHPVISADGSTIAYVGCTGNCKPITQGDRYDIYVSRRGVSGWSAPAVVASDPGAIYDRLGISADGKTISYNTNYLNFPFYAYNRAYVVQRTGETWGSPAAISTNDVNAFSTALSRDGKQVIWLSNPPPGGGSSNNVLKYASLLPGGGWSAPQILVANMMGMGVADYFRFSPDGNGIFYWGTDDLAAVHLYVLHRAGSAWSSPQQVTPGVIVFNNDGQRAGVNSNGTRVVYPDALTHNNVLDDVAQNMVEYTSGAWGAPVAVSAHKEGALYQYPMLSDDGTRLLALGPSPEYEGQGLVLFTYSVKYFTYFPFAKK